MKDPASALAAATPTDPSQLAGQLLALGTAFLWSISALSFESASRRAGSIAVNLIRLVIAFVLLCAIGAATRGRFLPTDATAYQWKWLLISGIVGFFIGDLCLFRALVILGARVTTLIMSLAPIIAAVTGYFWLGEQLTSWSFLGMMITLLGIVWVVSERATGADEEEVVDPSGEIVGAPRSLALEPASPVLTQARNNSCDAGVAATGIVLATLGAAGQGVGLVITKIGCAGAHRYDPFATTQIRVIAGIAVFAIFILAMRRQRDVLAAVRNRWAMLFMSAGAITGPFLGVSMLNASIQRIPTGVAQTIGALVPVLIIPFVVVLKKEHVSVRAILGALIAVAGVAVLMFSA